jgi:hypothetical protein
VRRASTVGGRFVRTRPPHATGQGRAEESKYVLEIATSTLTNYEGWDSTQWHMRKNELGKLDGFGGPARAQETRARWPAAPRSHTILVNKICSDLDSGWQKAQVL